MSLLYYFIGIIQDGDYLNDWLTHLPTILQPIILAIGHILATMLGS